MKKLEKETMFKLLKKLRKNQKESKYEDKVYIWTTINDVEIALLTIVYNELEKQLDKVNKVSK